jgi:hypothetical protein
MVLQQSIGAIPYFYAITSPGNLWDLTVDKAPTVSTMILSGPSIRPEKLTLVNRAKDAGIKVLGYVYTSYGDRSITAVKADIDTHYSYYGVDGIFLDQVDNTGNSTDLAYYTNLYYYIKAKPTGGIVALNPGASTKEAYAAIADHIMVFESTPAKYRTRSNPDWETLYPASLFWHAIHSCPAADVSEMLSLSRERNAGMIYITDDLMPNPYDALPTYWDSFVSSVEVANLGGDAEPLSIEEGGGGGGAGGSSGSGVGGGAEEVPLPGGALTAGGVFAGDRSKFPSRRRRGYAWKLCKYSTQYALKFDLTFVDANGDVLLDASPGNSTGRDHNSSADTEPEPENHTATEGRMNYRNNGGTPGWMCLDDNCPYFTANGKRYFEY